MLHAPHLVIGFCGPSGSGKSTISKAVQERFRFRHMGLPCIVVKFAEPIRQMLALVGVEKGDIPGETPHPLFRDAAQQIGTDFFRRHDEDFWVNIQRQRIGGMNAPTVLIYDDVRFHNEAAMCDLVVRLTTQRDTGMAGYQMVHASERGWETIPAHMEFATNAPSDVDGIAEQVYGRVVEALGAAKKERA